jgi:putative membrane protein
MKRLLLRWVLLALSVVAASYLTQAFGLGFSVDVSSGEKVLQLFIGVALLAILNATLGKILKLLTIPLNCMTLGLFSFVINALILWLTANAGFGLKITGDTLQQALAALVGSILISAINGILNAVSGDDKDKDD